MSHLWSLWPPRPVKMGWYKRTDGDRLSRQQLQRGAASRRLHSTQAANLHKEGPGAYEVTREDAACSGGL